MDPIAVRAGAPDPVLAAYDEAWNVSDAAARGRLLEQALSPDVELVDPGAGRFRGREAVAERIAGFGRRFGRIRRVVLFFGDLPPAC